MKKFMKIIVLFLMGAVLLLPNYPPAQAVSPPAPGDIEHFIHKLTAGPGGNIIEDEYYDNRVTNPPVLTSNLTLYELILPKYIEGYNETCFFYTFEFSSTEIPYVFGVNSKTLQTAGLFKLDSTKNKYIKVSSPQIINDPKLLANRDALVYLLGLNYRMVVYGADIINMSSNAETDASIDCPNIEIQNATKKVPYTPLAPGDTMFNKDQTDRYAAGRPPADALLHIFYKPSGAPIPLSEPIKEVMIDSKTVNGNPVDFFSIKSEKLAAGEYSFVTTWAVKSVAADQGSNRKFDNLNRGYDFYTELMRASTENLTYTNDFRVANFWPWLKTTLFADIPAMIGINNNKKDLKYATYRASSVFTVGADGTIVPTECPELNVTLYSNSIVEGDQKQDFCGTIDAYNIINWALCELLSITRGVADWAQEKAFSIFETMTNIEIDSTPTHSTPTPTPAPAATSPPTTFNDQDWHMSRL